MNVSIDWLKHYVDIEGLSVKELSDGLTLAGLEVEGRITKAKVEGVVTAKCLTKEKHPNADKLNLCTVTDGKDKFKVVCGAPNVEAGQVVVLAKIGAKLPEIVIKEAKIRGVESEGMLCSEAELGASDDHSGIIILHNDTPLGQDINEILGLGDTILELNVTPNRPDWLSIIGVAREVSAVFGRKLNLPKYELKEISEETAKNISIEVKDIDKCPIYTARIIKGVKLGPSPLWMQKRLVSCGIRAINNVVDVTNYILMEYAQPLHAFDLRQVDKGIVVRNAKKGEKIVTLDAKEYVLQDDMLVIADHSKLLGIAGVMGGEYTSIAEDTDTVMLECGYFSPDSVRSTSKRLGLSSDSSYRYERGIDYSNTEIISDYAAYMIAEYCGGEIYKSRAGGVFKKLEISEVESSATNINKLLGTDIKISEMADYLDRLSIKTSIKGDNLYSLAPAFRVDIKHESDIAEEVARLYGYDKIDTTIPPLNADSDEMLPEIKYTRIIRNKLSSLGFSEVVNFSFSESSYLKRFDNEDKFVKLLNPISADMDYMRTMVFPSVIKNMETNWNQGHTNIRLFEVSKSFVTQGADKLAIETQKLAFGVMGEFLPLSYIKVIETDTFFYLKGIIGNLFSSFALQAEYERISDMAFLHPGKSAKITINGNDLGFIGALHPNYVESLDLKKTPYIAELDFSALIDLISKRKIKYTKFSRFPYVERDFSIVIPNDAEIGAILKDVYKASDLVRDVRLFDEYAGKGIAEGHRSVAFRVVFSCLTKTLNDDDINPIITLMLSNLEKKFGAKLR